MVTLQIANGATFQIDWVSGINIQQALEAAYNAATKGILTYSLQYFGSNLGYLVTMMNETYETYNSREAPYFFWEINLNNKPITKGIDNTYVSDGDVIVFTFETYDSTIHADSTLQVKYQSKS